MPRKSESVTGTREWASREENCLTGCSHACWYCYARAMASRLRRIDPSEWRVMKPAQRAGRTTPFQLRSRERIMFPTSHDITPEFADVCIRYMDLMLRDPMHHDLLVVTKPHIDVIVKICKELESYRGRILFRFTIGSANDRVLSLWEPGAPSYAERLESLRYAFGIGWKTSISCEPMLDDDISSVIADVEGSVTDAIWLGKMNRIRARLAHNGATPAIYAAAAELEALQSDGNIRALYEAFKDHPKVKWKDSIKSVVGLAQPVCAGLDI